MSKMIYIFSQKRETSTNKVVSYLPRGYFTIIFESSVAFISKFDKTFDNDIRVWIRRGVFPNLPLMSRMLKYELKVLQGYFHYRLERLIFCLGSVMADINHNKLIDLFVAKEIGLKIPESRICLFYEEVLQFKKDVGKAKLITEAFKNNIQFNNNQHYYSSGPTALVKNLVNTANNYFPSLIQKFIPKIFEVRSFFLCGAFYSMAIFSQKNEKTKIDFRNYDDDKPNRNVPFKLPNEMEDKLTKLMDKLELNTGSIDLIYSTDGKFYFLEVNPCGQFDWLSVNCNYYVERHIANILSGEAA